MGDFDNDSWRDIFVANGHVFPNVDQIQESSIAPCRQQCLLFRNLGNGRFEVQPSLLHLDREQSSRGAASPDFDGDGRLDVVLSSIDAVPALFWNESADGNQHLRIRLVGSGSNRLALGAQATVRSRALRQLRAVRSGGSYLSQDELILHFGLGSRTKADSVEVRWPTGEV